MYNETNFLNTNIVTDLHDLFSGFLIDLRDIKTCTTLGVENPALINLFENLLNGNPGVAWELSLIIRPSPNVQYRKGI